MIDSGPHSVFTHQSNRIIKYVKFQYECHANGWLSELNESEFPIQNLETVVGDDIFF